MKNKILFIAVMMTALFMAAVNIYGAKADIPYISYELTYNGEKHLYNAQELYIKINGESLDNEQMIMPPVIMNGNTLVPAREVFEKLGASVAWKSELQEVDVSYKDKFVVMFIGNNTATVAGENVTMNISPQIINDKTMIPLRFVSEAVGIDVEWIDETRTINLNEANDEEENESEQGDNVTTIDDEEYEETKITGFEMPKSGNEPFIINADGRIGKFDYFTRDKNRLIIDIYNAENIENKEVYNSENSLVTGVEIFQKQEKPKKITRVILDLNNDAEYEVNLSEERKRIEVNFGGRKEVEEDKDKGKEEFEGNNIYDIAFTKDEENDYIRITGDYAPEMTVSSIKNPDRIMFDIKNARLSIDNGKLEGGRFVKGIEFVRYNSSTVRIIVEADLKSGYSRSTDGNTAIISFYEPKPISLEFISEYNRLKIGKNGKKINIKNVVENDDYKNLTYTMTFGETLFNGGYSENITSENDNIESINILSGDMGTTITFNEKRIMAYVISEDESYIYITAVKPKDKYSKIVVVDAGHGGSDCGAIGNGLYEEDITLDIIRKIIDIAEEDKEIKIYATRTEDFLVAFDDISGLGNEVGDMFVSVHINSAGANSFPNGTEVYMLNDNTTQNGLTSTMLAQTMQNNLVNYLGSADRGVKSENFIVLRQSTIPAVLCEIGFITNPTEAGKLGTDEYRYKTAQAIYDGCKELLEDYGR